VLRLVDLGVHVLVGLSGVELRAAVAHVEGAVDALMAISPERLAGDAFPPAAPHPPLGFPSR
jgi:hypothetical protein